MDRLGSPSNASISPHDMPANSHPTPGSSTSGRKGKIMNAMKRSFSPRSPRVTKDDDAKDGGYSYFHHEERAGRVPTVEQISMGLHLSRTPHLRSTSGRGRSMSSEVPTKPDAKPVHHSRTSLLPPKPALKKIASFQTAPTSTTPSFTNVSSSTSTTLSSAISQTDRQTPSFTPRLFSRMSKIIPPSRDTEPDPETPLSKKSVRFSVDETR